MPTGALNNLPSAIALMVLTAILFTLRRRNRHLYIDTWVAAIFITFLAQLLWFIPVGFPTSHRPVHICALIANVLIGLAFALFNGKQNRPGRRRVYVLSLNAVPIIALVTIYGFDSTLHTSYYACAIFGIICALASLFLHSRTFVVIQGITWLLVIFFISQNNLRAAAYFATGSIYLYAAVNTWRMLSRRLGRIAIVTSLSIWAASFYVHPWVIAHPTYVTFATKIWEMQKFFAIVAMLLILLEYESSENQRLALHDQLTGLANRRLMEQRFLAAIKSGSCELILIDLNGFKAVNDTLGHLAGDDLLIEVSRKLHSLLAPNDTLARVGGDEFVIVSTQGNKSLAVHIRDAFPMSTTLAAPGDVVHACVGVACFPEDCTGLSGTAAIRALTQLADARMYAQKRIAAEPFR